MKTRKNLCRWGVLVAAFAFAFAIAADASDSRTITLRWKQDGDVAGEVPEVHELVESHRGHEATVRTELGAKELTVVRQFARDPGSLDIEGWPAHDITSSIGPHSSFAMASFCPLWRYFVRRGWIPRTVKMVWKRSPTS